MSLSVERRQVTVDSRTISCLAAGPWPAGRLAVFLHAFPLAADMWVPQLQALPVGWSAVAPDFRGFDGSDPDAASATRADAAMLHWLAAVPEGAE